MLTFYNRLARELADPRCIFLNFGYCGPEAEGTAEPAGELHEQDRPYRYHFNLVRKVLGDTPVAGKRVLEVGCGRGGNCLQLERYSLAAEVVGLDLCLGNTAFCTRVHSLDRARFLAGNAESLPFAGGSFDVVLNLESSHCYDDFAAFLAEVRRVLKPGGIFCWADLWGLQDLRDDWLVRQQSLDHAGFEVLAEEDISEPVFLALKQEDGLSGLLLSMAGADNRELIEGLNKIHEAVRLHIAAGRCHYRLRRLRNR